MKFRFLIFLLLKESLVSGTKVAVIGNGVSGSFVTKYLTDYDGNCTISSITIFEPTETMRNTPLDKEADINKQGSRVASVELADGTIVEIGASIAHKGFHHVLAMIQNDPEVIIAEPFHPGIEIDKDKMHTGFGIYDGRGWPVITAGLSAFYRKLRLLWRYSWDLVKVDRACRAAQAEFAKLPHLLDSVDPDTFYSSPEEIWKALGLQDAVHSSFAKYLDKLGVAKGSGFIRSLLLPEQGSLRHELLSAINLVNYNQDLDNINGLVGLGSFAATSGGLFSIKGGNYQIIRSARRQADEATEKHCEGTRSIVESKQTVATVVGSLDGFVLYSDSEEIGTYDIVILAAPIQQSRISFLIQSVNDPAVLQTMPLGGLIDAHNSKTDEGHSLLPHELPASARRSYTQVVTTVVSSGVLNKTALSMNDEDESPRAIMMNKEGKAAFHNITVISQITPSGVYKVFSNEILERHVLELIFGEQVKVEYMKPWGGRYGGATPDYRGEGNATTFLLYDAASGLEGHSKAALYYPNAMEQSSLACIEMSAVGAKAVAKLIARRLGLIGESITNEHDEL